MATFVKVQTLDADNKWAKDVVRWLNVDLISWVDSETGNRLAVRTSDTEPTFIDSTDPANAAFVALLPP